MADDTPAEKAETFERQMDVSFGGRPSDNRWYLLNRDDQWEFNKLDSARWPMVKATIDPDRPVRRGHR